MLNFAEIESAARSRAVDCLVWLLPDGKLQGNEFRALNPTRQDRKAGSFAYNVKKHVWSDFASNDKGSGIIALWRYLRHLPVTDAANELAQWLGLDTNSTHTDFIRRVSPEPTAKVTKAAKHGKWVAQLWRQSIPATGTAAETYLHSRGLLGAIPPTLRFLPAHRHYETGLIFPVLLAAITVWPSKKIVALHRTFLKPDGSGKANVSPNKKMINPVAEGGVRLAPAGEVMAVGEGIETCLAVQQANHLPTWAALSTSGLMNLILPAMPIGREIVIAADNDEAGIAAAHKAAERWLYEGRRVRLAIPKTTKDFNDLLRLP